jgi:hypothetical protein
MEFKGATSQMRYEFVVDGSNDVFGQDETDASLAMRSIKEAHAALNYMATDYGDWFEPDGFPKSVVALRRQSDHRLVAEFRPRYYRTPPGAMKVRWTRVRAQLKRDRRK